MKTEDCWNSPLPCTPSLTRALCQRPDSDLRSGFAVTPPHGSRGR